MSEKDVGILKTIWRKDEKSDWIIHDLKGIDLKPREGFSKDFYKIDNDVILMTKQPNLLTDDLSLLASFGTTEFLVRQSIVPIVAWNNGDKEVHCIGTGFFISASGLLMTAAHVIRDPIDERYTNVTQVNEKTQKLDDNLRFGILLPVNPAMRSTPFVNTPPEIRKANCFMCSFEWTQHWGREIESPLMHETPKFEYSHDIAICKVSEHQLIGPYQPLNIGLHNLKLGDRAVAIGYPEMRNIKIGADDEYQPELMVSVGSVTNIHHDNTTEKRNSTPGPNFEFDAKIPGKMSGSPILVGGGVLTKGIVSRSWKDTNHASGCLVAPTLSLPIINEKNLLDIIKSGEEGISQVSGSDL